MLLFVLSLLSIVSCKEFEQTLVFGKDDTGHFCDFSLNPPEKVVEVAIFEVISNKDDHAVPRCRLTPVGSPRANGSSRIEIPEKLACEGVRYSFKFILEDEQWAFSENWTFDGGKGEFALESSVKKSFLKDSKFQIGAALTGLLVFAAGTSYFYKRMKKSRNTL